MIFLLEILLRYVGFGSPVIYEKKFENYYPQPNQELRRFKGKKIKINFHGMRTNFDWNNLYNKKKNYIFWR